MEAKRLSSVMFRKHRVFRETDDVVFYDITVEESNASDLVVHEGAATSPPDDFIGAKQFYIHSFQDDYNRVVSGERTFELVNYSWKCPYHIVNLNRSSGALFIPRGTYHRSVSGEGGSIVIILETMNIELLCSNKVIRWRCSSTLMNYKIRCI